MLRRHLGVVFVVILSAAMVVLAAGLNLPEEVSDYISWQRGNLNKSFEQSAHPNAKDIYFNDIAAQSIGDTLVNSSFPFAEGSVVLKERTDPETLNVVTLYTMRKVAGFNPEGGDWQYGVFERQEDGSFGGGWRSIEQAQGCAACHSLVADKDFTYLSYLGR